MGQSSHLGNNAGCTAPMKPYKMVFTVFIFPGVGAESRLTPPSRCRGVQVGSGSDPCLAQSCIEYICNKYKKKESDFPPTSSLLLLHPSSIRFLSRKAYSQIPLFCSTVDVNDPLLRSWMQREWPALKC